MRKLLMMIPFIASISFAQYFDGDVIREFGVKTGIVRADYNSKGGKNRNETLDEFISVYGYMGAKTTAGFNAGAAIELSTGSKMDSDLTLIYTSIELNPVAELYLTRKARVYTGFGGSINRFKEHVGGKYNSDTNFGLQFFLGGKFNITSTIGLLGEYKGKIFMVGDYDSDVVHHFNIGLVFLVH